jgi:hypothetical protein
VGWGGPGTGSRQSRARRLWPDGHDLHDKGHELRVQSGLPCCSVESATGYNTQMLALQLAMPVPLKLVSKALRAADLAALLWYVVHHYNRSDVSLHVAQLRDCCSCKRCDC